MLNTWTNHFDIPVFNYYESFKDLRFMLVERPKGELNVAQYEFLADKLMEIQDWFALQMDESTYKSTYKSISRLYRYKFMRHSLNVMLAGLKAYGLDTRTEWLMDGETLAQFKASLQSLKIPFRIKIFDQIKDIERRIIGLNNDIGILENKLKSNETMENFDYMELVMYANKTLGFRINPREFTLHEWVAALKLIKKQQKKREQ